MKISESYKRAHITQKFDAIIVGSGLGGLTSAALLSQEGKKVLVLEKHYVIGGFTHVFKRKDYEWDVGVHYVGEVNKEYALLKDIFNEVSEGNLLWKEMDDVYDTVVIGDNIYPFPKGKDNLREALISWFPAEQKAIEEYFVLVSKIARSANNFFMDRVFPIGLGNFIGFFTRRKFLKLSDKTTLEVLSGLTKNKELIAVLCGQYGDYGMPPAQSSFAMHAILVRHYFAGGNYPIGGAASFANIIGGVILKHGGKLFTNADVSEIIVKENKAIGVKMADGSEIFADNIVSNVGAFNTYNHLIPKANLIEHKMNDHLNKMDHSTAHICLYVGIKESAESLGLGTSNYWLYPHNDHDKSVEEFLNDKNAPFPVVYISFPSAKDPEWNKHYPDKSTIEIITCMPYEWFKKWESESWKKRGDEYEKYKEELSQRLLEYLYKHKPQVKGKIDYYELSTPLSTKHFTSYEEGEIYGLNHGPARFRMDFLRTFTPIKKFFLTGQDIVSVGIGGAAFSGVLTATSILKKNMIGKIQKNQKK